MPDPEDAPLRQRHHDPVLPGRPVYATANVCHAAGCLSLGSDLVFDRLCERVEALGAGDVAVRRVGCLGLCAQGPLVQVPEHDHLYTKVSAEPGELDDLVEQICSGTGGLVISEDPFFARQVKVVLRHCGSVDPEEVEDYVAKGGYVALRKAVTEMAPEEVVAEVTASGLRGRGGAGYPTGLKWATVAKSGEDGRKYVVCNADEGDPGAFMDRSVLESCPQQVLEGMAIAAYAVGAIAGYVYVRAEYPLTVRRLNSAIRQAERAGLLGTAIADSSFSFHVEVRIGAGAFVCGEETALLASIEGRRGTPRPRPPYPATAGLFGEPTLINNVETFASISAIIEHGGQWYAAIGANKSRGTKVFALAGAVARTGLIEVPMGLSLREIVFDIGGGVQGGHRCKAVQTGGPSGGCIPEELLDMPVDYESLVSAGSIMGSGGMIVMDETTCMVDVARYFVDFCKEESCSRCVPCRAGTVQMHRLLDRICSGLATRADLERLERLATMVQRASLCGLGQGAPSTVFSTLRYFKDEYLAHIDQRTCPAGVCEMAPIEATMAGSRR